MSESGIAIRLADVTKRFPSGSKRRSLFGTVRSWFGAADASASFDALHCVNLTVPRGEWIGLVGNNGSGKSTLLRVIAGLHPPSSGQVEVNGERTLLAGLGVGMVDELRVEKNIFLFGAMHGIGREELRGQVDEILDWADLREFRHAPLKTLSTGMRSRLAFSITRHFRSDIFLLDEALTAGDRAFREKCEAVFAGYARDGRTMVIASHDAGFVARHCHRAIWLQRGRTMALGAPREVLAQYSGPAEVPACRS